MTDRAQAWKDHFDLVKRVERADAAIERLRAALTEARAWFLLPDNIDLNGSDRVYRLVDDALGTTYEQQEMEVKK